VLDAFVDLANVTLTRGVYQLRNVYDPAIAMRRVVEDGYQIVLPTVGLHAQF
jgi:hypothetical protein